MAYTKGQTLLGKYGVVRLRGEQSGIETYEGAKDGDGSRVVLRVMRIPEDSGLLEKFNASALKLARIRHDYVAELVDFGVIDHQNPCLVYSPVPGPTLAEYVDEAGPLKWTAAFELMAAVLDGLQSLHEGGILHGDLNPSSIYLMHADLRQPRIADAGIAQADIAYEKKVAEGYAVGSPAFMSPEQLYGLALDERSDLYSVALVLYRVITGQDMEVTSARDALERRVMNRLPPMVAPAGKSVVPGQAKDLVSCAMEPDPAKRPASAKDFAKRMRALIQDSDTGRREPTAGSVRRARSGRRRNLASTNVSAGWTPPAWAATQPPVPQKAAETSEVETTIEAVDIQGEELLNSAGPPEAPPPLPMDDALEVNGEAATEVVLPGPEVFGEALSEGGEGAEPEIDGGGAIDELSPEDLDQDRFGTRKAGFEARVVLVARIPDRRLRMPSETRWIRDQLGKQSYGFTVGQTIWVGTIVTGGHEEAEAIATQTKEAMFARYGDDLRAEWTKVDKDFEIDSSSVLPTIVEGLIHYLSH